MSSETKNFPEQVKEVRRQLELSQQGLAHALGVSFATVNRWENGKTTPSKMARTVWKQFCQRQIAEGKLDV
jgi:DNA-binding transcriptional regulator YiaG